MGSEIAFWLKRFASFALHTDCLPACDQSPLKCDWSILPGLQTETRMLPIPKSCPTGNRFCIHMQVSVHKDYRSVNSVNWHKNAALEFRLLIDHWRPWVNFQSWFESDSQPFLKYNQIWWGKITPTHTHTSSHQPPPPPPPPPPTHTHTHTHTLPMKLGWLIAD